MSAGANRIGRRFAALRDEGRGGLVTFVTAGDPNPAFSAELIRGLPAAGADLIELGMPFTDPMADGPSIQASSLRALRAGATMKATLAQVTAFRGTDGDTPVILMGYYNPIYIYGVDAFLADARAAGVDGLIIVDLPPEEDDELRPAAQAAGLEIVRLATPTTDAARLPTVLAGSGGFLYYVSITGITGTKQADNSAVAEAIERIRPHTDLPIAVGFGIRTPEQAAEVARAADAAVVGSALVDRIAGGLDETGAPSNGLLDDVLAFVGTLAVGVRGARR